jgi:hypothetical protein
MVFLAQLTFGAYLATSLDNCEHFCEFEVAEEVGLVVIGLLGEAGRGKGILKHHLYIINI